MLSKLSIIALLASISTLARADFYVGDESGSLGIGDSGLGGGGNVDTGGVGIRQAGSDCLSGHVFDCSSDACIYGRDSYSIKSENDGNAYDFYKDSGGDGWTWFYSGGGQGGTCVVPDGKDGDCVYQSASASVLFDAVLKCTGDLISY